MTERKSERAELVARIERAFQRNVNCVITPVEARGYLTTLRSLAAQDQKPVAWLQSRNGVEIVCKSRLDTGGFERGWTEKPLYLSAPPAADWDEAVNASANLCYTAVQEFASNTPRIVVAQELRSKVNALRRNPPPDSGAGKSTKDAIVYGVGISLGGHHVPLDQYYEPPKKSDDERGLPDHGGADAGVEVKPLEWSVEARHYMSIHHGRGLGFDYEAAAKVYSSGWIVTLGDKTIYDDSDGDQDSAKAAAQADYERRVRSALSKPAPVAANASAEQWATDLPDGSVFLDAYAGWSRERLKERCLELVGRVEQLECAPNASAEARLREAWPNDGEMLTLLEQAGFDTNRTHPECFNCFGWKTFTEKLKAKILSSHPHASNCDKQGWLARDVEAATKRVAEWKSETMKSEGGESDAERTQRRLAVSDDGLGPMQAIPREPPSGPSDRTADVTETEIAVVLANAGRDARGYEHLTQKEVEGAHLWPDDSESKTQARALLEAFTVGRR